jgi:ABC-type nitrate/sulfonate/bicarbonate transport system permease component
MAASTASGTAQPAAAPPGSETLRYLLRKTIRAIVMMAASVLILAVLWDVTIVALHASPFFAKKPLDVWDYLFVGNPLSSTTPGQNRAQLLGLLWVTLGHAGIGFIFGVGGSILIAILFALVRPLEFMFMPVAMLMRTVPLLAMAPVIYLIFGNGMVTAALIGGVVVFFPLLVNLTVGFASVSPQAVDLIRAYGGSRWTIMRKAAFPAALPHFFASMRIAVPGAITGAMLYEWLFTYQGLGAAITYAKNLSDYGEMWTIAAFITVVTIVLYTVVTIIEEPVLAKWGPEAGRLPVEGQR